MDQETRLREMASVHLGIVAGFINGSLLDILVDAVQGERDPLDAKQQKILDTGREFILALEKLRPIVKQMIENERERMVEQIPRGKLN